MNHGEKSEAREDNRGHMAMVADFRRRTIAVFFLTLPVLLFSGAVSQWFGVAVPDIGINTIALVASAVAIMVYGGAPFFRGAVASLKTGVMGMNVLVSLALLAGFLYSLGATFIFSAPDLYWEISTLTLFLLFGHWMEMRAVAGNASVVEALAGLIPRTAHVVSENGDVRDVETGEVAEGDVLLVRPGEQIPVDGVVVRGSSHANEAFITGESTSIPKKAGSRVVGGSVNMDGALYVRAASVGEATVLAQIIRLVREVQSSKSDTGRLADRAAHYLTIVAVLVGVSTFVFWFGIAGAGVVFALTLAITVLVIACPHALGLAIPAVTTISTTLAAKNGILVKNMEGIERMRDVSMVVFDKTGTLTSGEFGVSDIVPFSGWSEEDIIRRAAALEIQSAHSIARAIVKKADETRKSPLRVEDFVSDAGKGISGRVDGEMLFVGSVAYIKSKSRLSGAVAKDAERLASQGKTVVLVADEDEVKGIVALADLIRPESYEAVRKIQEHGIAVSMITGDDDRTAGFVARELGLDTYSARVLPDKKAAIVRALQEEGHTVAMVGDGINDAPALAQADVGIAIGAGTRIAMESAQIVLMRNNPLDIVKIVALSKKTMAKMKQNLWWATGYNIVAIPVAAGVLFSYGILLRPEYGALLMAGSSVIVVLNAFTLRLARI